MTLKAIETSYKGYRFRSRLEARWAVFFDALDIGWEYEKEGFDLDGMWYLPDFWIPARAGELETFGYTEQQRDDPGMWIEIKPMEPTAEEEERARRLALQSGLPVLILIGSTSSNRHYVKAFSPWARDGVRFGWSAFTECPNCHRVEICPYGQLLFLGCDCPGAIEGTYDDETGEDTRALITGMTGPRLEAAVNAARSARFEHGEHGGR